MIRVNNSRERMLDLMFKVNKINLFESVVDDNLSTSFGMLRNDSFRVGGDGNCKIKTQRNDDGMFVEFNCVDGSNNTYIFKFQIIGGSDVVDSGIYKINEINLVEYSFKGVNGSVSSLSGVKLDDFNRNNSDEYFDVINKYIEMDFDSEETVEYN